MPPPEVPDARIPAPSAAGRLAAGRILVAAGQRLVFTFERHDLHELANHAAAGAYAFLLSSTPAVIVVLSLATALLRRIPRALAAVMDSIRAFTGPIGADRIAEAFLSRPLGLVAGLIGLASLVWAARLFVVTIQRGIRVVWSDLGRPPAIRENLLSFAVELLALLAAVLVLAGAQATRLLAERSADLFGGAAARILAAGALSLPALGLLCFVYLSYRYIPPERPRRRAAAAASFATTGLYLLMAALLGLLLDAARYDLLYGVLGGLVMLLVKVYAFFWLYFWGAELCYVLTHFDALLFARYRRVAARRKVGGLERALFAEPTRLLERYARRLEAGELLFAEGSRGKEAYVVHRGAVGIFVGAGGAAHQVARLGSGQLFGEMAQVLDEPRTATARALEPSLVLELPPAVFTHYLRSDQAASRGLVDSLSERLKGMNARVGQDRGSPAERGAPREGAEGEEGRSRGGRRGAKGRGGEGRRRGR